MLVFARASIVESMTHHYFAGDNRTTRERLAAGDLYIMDDPELELVQRNAARLAEAYRQADLNNETSAKAILSELLGSVGEQTTVRSPLYVDYGKNITIGSGVYINFNLTALDGAPIVIGDNCQIGPGVKLLTASHPLDPTLRRDDLESAHPIRLGENVWIGGGVIVCPGVTIGDNSVIGAGSVVTKDIPSNVVAVGTPARQIKSVG